MCNPARSPQRLEGKVSFLCLYWRKNRGECFCSTARSWDNKGSAPGQSRVLQSHPEPRLACRLKRSTQKNKARVSSFHYIILIALTPRNMQNDKCQEPTIKERFPSIVGLFHSKKKNIYIYKIIIALFGVQTQPSLFTHSWVLL